MSTYTDRDRIIALSGLFQAARLTFDIAHRGSCDALALQHSIGSLFVFNPATVPEVFGDACGVVHGARALIAQLEQPDSRHVEISHYVIALTLLCAKIEKNPRRLDALSAQLLELHNRIGRFELGDSMRHARLAEIYQDLISPMRPQIMVKGEPAYLQNPDNAARIRSALLAGIRSAMLWRQCGGKRRHLMLSRKKLVLAARELLDQCDDMSENPAIDNGDS
jgi:high frequency lysogenization protein